MNRIGPQMQAAVDYVAANPGCVMLAVAKHLHMGARTGRNNAYGYNPVHRAIRVGLIRKEAGVKRGSYALFVK